MTRHELNAMRWGNHERRVKVTLLPHHGTIGQHIAHGTAQHSASSPGGSSSREGMPQQNGMTQ